ncbi:hypothetical protein [Streptomyces sp. NPDC090022]|uniref:hypothetical protein n=1 Tax=Streptomyces sp. NPDC090022 TaxID=3365920 RepID=UPI003815BE35
MTSTHLADTRDTAPDTARDRRAYIAPLLSTLLTLPLGLLSLFVAGLSPMACDSCGEADSDRFDASFETAFPIFGGGLVIVLVLLIATWALPWQRRYAARRVALALWAPGFVVVNYVVFWGLIDWP